MFSHFKNIENVEIYIGGEKINFVAGSFKMDLGYETIKPVYTPEPGPKYTSILLLSKKLLGGIET